MVQNIGKAQSDELPALLEVSRAAISYLLDGLHVSPTPMHRDFELESRVRELAQSWPFGERIRPHIVTALTITETAYHHVSDMNAKVAITVFTALLTCMDDPGKHNSDAVDSIDHYRRLCNGSAMHDPGMLGELNRCLKGMWDLYPPLGANAIFIATLKFMNGTMLENSDESAFSNSSGSRAFVEYQRNLTGISEAYAFFIWDKKSFPDSRVYERAIPDAALAVNYVNDLLSFYKEEAAGEMVNYIHNRAIVMHRSAAQTLCEVADEIIAASARVRSNLLSEDAIDAWDSFEKGYIMFHIGDPRYRLQEILGMEYMIDAY
ncbi:terpenoid synthase [Laetiporus sulphureus 93-53]|uniref:Terpenoid synthase n=1 Tax=Laetiporus sulphureus 93-53 TaxID=1314785 RepID=A0A165B112_9APHY|nr:terpenoid synthase [Laetiporus sulphureus 93-53]KZT00026.1 terpenoid synthase [Laetiporus sulphureus 93-53]